MPEVYLDHASTTPVAREVLEAMAPYFRAYFANPSSPHSAGRAAREAVETARASVAAMLGCTPREVYFTSGGSEGNNLAIFGAAWAQAGKKNHVITSTVEHHSVLRSCQALEKQGWKVTYLPVDGAGRVEPQRLRKAIRRETALVTIMHANNEVGTIQPVEEIGAVCREAGVLFHTDAVQTAAHVPLDVSRMNVDLLSLSAHKLYGPKGAGALYVRQGVHISPLIHGGGHERGRRSGTENVPGIVGLGRASDLAMLEMETEMPRQIALRDRLIEGVMATVPDTFTTGHAVDRLPNSASFVVMNVDGEGLLMQLDAAGIAASSGSACTSGSLEPSHVLLAMGLPPVLAYGSLRLTVGRDTKEEDIDYVLQQLPEIVTKVRAHSKLNGLFECDCLDGECG